MIKCLVCKEYLDEGYFVELRYGGLAICSNCKDTPEAEKLREESAKAIEAMLKRQEAYEAEREEKIRNQDYEGQYDWMGMI